MKEENTKDNTRNRDLTTCEFYAYSWHIDEEYQDETFIRIYGFNDQNQNICVSVNGFRPFVWVELPTHIDWKNLSNKENLYHHFRQLFPDIKCTLKFCRKLYGANLKKKDGDYVHKLFPFVLCSFASYRDLKFNFPNKLKTSQRIMGLGNLKFHVHGQDACPRLQLTSKYNLPTAGWIKIKGIEVLNNDEKFTTCDKEFLVNLNNKQYKVEELICKSDKTTIPKPLILSFDLEVNSEDQITMPKATRPGDVVFQISCVFSRLGTTLYDKYLLSLGNPQESIVGAQTLKFTTEKKLLMGFKELINQKNPNVIIGYNIFNFDIPYLMDRANYKSIYPEWSQQGFPKDRCGIQREIKWSSSAYKNQEFKFLDCEGRLYIDLLPVVQRDFKLNDYKLKTVSTYFIGETKDDLDPKSIFKCYVEGTRDDSERASKYMSICGKYCMQDSMLVTKLFEKLNVWYGLSEMAVVCNVPMITLFTKGQQIKVYSSLYKYCLENKIVPEKDGYTVAENERYVGAYVFAPKPGLYENVVPVDFNSLYPSLIISYNLDYTTCAFDPSIPDELCHVMEWEDHISCKHDPKVIEKSKLTKIIDDVTSKKKLSSTQKNYISQLRKQRSEITKSLNKNVMCEKRKYRFLKTENHPEFKGVLPNIVQSLLDARKETRKEMSKLKDTLKTISDEIERKEVETTISILNQRQLAYKVSANSMYGITGVKAGMLPFMPVAMSITYMGRTNIMKVAEVIQSKYNGEIVAGDTDSNYISFPVIKSIPELWDHAIKVAEEVSGLFPPPMKLEFEEAIYTKFLILTKKRYMYKTATRDGTIKPEIGKRGVLLNRRDNSAFIRNTYENMVRIIFDNTDTIDELKKKVISTLINDINLMFTNQLPIEDFVITKSTGDYGDLKAQYFQNEKGLHRAMLGQYNVPFLTDDIRMSEGIITPQKESDWYLDKLPAHIQLLEKIKRRGQMRNEGSRLEYVIVETDDLKAKQSEKIETLSYYKKNKDVLHLDYLYYLQRLINPVDQILEVIFGLKNFMKSQCNARLLKKKLTIQINNLFSPKLNIQKDRLYLLKCKDKYRLICGDKQDCKNALQNMDYSSIVLKLDYTPFLNENESLFNYLRHKYDRTTSSLKTQFNFTNQYILLGDMTETKLVSTIKREIK
jgi:DNA polymerase elongation subunit (family B)